MLATKMGNKTHLQVKIITVGKDSPPIMADNLFSKLIALVSFIYENCIII